MSSLIPVHASEHVLGGVSEYLATAFSLANPETSNALKAFLEDTERGMFHGPYVRVRLPYARAIGWDGILDWMPSWFTPYPTRRKRSAGCAAAMSTGSTARIPRW